MEVDLELSVGGSFRNLKTSKPQIDPPFELRGCLRSEDAKAKRDIQTQRRREAKKKREERKKKGMGNGEGGGGKEGMRLEMQRLQSRVRDRERRQNNEQTVLTHHKSNTSSHPNHGAVEAPIQMMVPIQYAYPSRVQYVPFAFPYVVPCWTPAAGVQPARQGSGAGSLLSEGCTNSSASASHHDEGSSDIGSDSHAGTAAPPQSSDAQGQSEQSVSSSHATSSDKATSCDEKVSPAVKDPATRRQETPRCPLKKVRNGNASIPVEQMPCVSATGKGPNGRTITGFLYRYSKAEINIVCVCHGISFSPAGFVEHAGGVDVSHPLKHITVIPSAFACS